MITLFFALLSFSPSDTLKIWIPNTDVNNELNWDKKDVPKDCDGVRFQAQAEVAAYWNLKNIVITGLSLPETGDIIFPHDVSIRFRNREKCPRGRGILQLQSVDLKYIRNEIKGWLDPHNWESDSEDRWLPHSERVPCAGEAVLFPPQRTFAAQLPNILIPIGSITFDNEVFRGDTWSDFLKTELGFRLFKGPDDVRNTPWRNDVGCSTNKKCACWRSSYSIRDGLYRETDPRIFQEAVCLYAMPKCEPSSCYSPVVPEGHCCGICGAVIKIEDNLKEGLNISNLKSAVEAELEHYDAERKLKTYVGRTTDENIQIVVIAENSEDTIRSHTFANLIRRQLTDQKPQTRISSRVSGLQFSNYLFNSVSGAVFGTLAAVLILFMSIYYIYLVLPKRNSATGNPFMFARFENIVNEENLEIGVEAGAPQDLPQAFDNPMYSGSAEARNKCTKSTATDLQLKGSESSKISEAPTTKEYSNPIYSELEETKEASQFLACINGENDEFSEIKL